MNIKALGTALKNKVTSKVGGAMAAPYVKVKESQTRTADRNYNFLKDYSAKNKRGIATEKEQAIYKSMK
jgi:hypothetical protein